VIVASNITGNSQLIMAGQFNLVLQGSNTFAGPALMNNSNGGMLTLANLYGFGTNSVTVSNGTVVANLNVNGASYLAGNGWNNQTILVTGGGSLWTNLGAFVDGTGAATNTTAIFDNGGRLIAATLLIGTNNAFGNSLIVTNGGSLSIAGATTVGFNAASNSLVIVGGSASGVTSLWNAAAQTITIGRGTATGDTLRIDGDQVAGGAILTNLGALNILQGSIQTDGTASISGSSTTIVSDAGSVWSNLTLVFGNSGAPGTVIVSNGASFFSGRDTFAPGCTNGTPKLM